MKKLLPFLAYAILVLVVFWGVLWPAEGNILFGPDIWRYHYWQRQFLGIALKLGNIPWWNPYIFAGQPYLEHPQIPFWYLPNLLFVFIATNKAISWYIAIHIFWAMAGMYTLIESQVKGKSKKEKGVDDPILPFAFYRLPFSLPAWAAGVSFGLSSYFVGRIYAGHIDIIAASSWVPWVVWGALSYSPRWSFGEAGQLSADSSKKWSVIAGVALAMQLLSGHQMVAVYTVEALGVIAVVFAIVQRSLRPILYTFITIIFGVALAAIQILPNQQMVARSIRTMPLGMAWSAIAAARPAHFLEFLDTGYFYKTIYTDIPDDGLGHERAGYIGKIPLLIALTTILFVLAKRQKNPVVWTLGITGVLSLWIWMGKNAPVDLFALMQKIVPLYSQIRIPSRHIILFVFAGSALFGIGMSRIKNVVIQIVLVAFILADLVPLAWQNIHSGTIPERAEDKQLVGLLTRNEGLARFLPDFYHGEPIRDVLEFDAPTVHKIFSVSGYDQPPLRNYYEFLLAVNNLDIRNTLQYIETIPPFRAITSPYLNFLNVKYILVPRVSDPMKNIRSGQFLLVGESESRGWRLYENKNVIPRFFIATQIQRESDRRAVLAAIQKGSVDPTTTIIVDGATVDTSGFVPDCPAGYQGKVNVASYGYGSIVLTSNTSCNAFLATSEIMYPGWTATIDGKPTSVFESNAAFRTLYLPKGTHTIVFSYRPTIVLLGALISIATLVIIILSFARPGLAKLIISFFPQFHVSPHR